MMRPLWGSAGFNPVHPRERRVKVERTWPHLRRRRSSGSSRAGVPAGKPHATLTGRERALPAAPAHRGGLWQFVYRIRGLGRAGRQRTVTIGAWPAIDAAQARPRKRGASPARWRAGAIPAPRSSRRNAASGRSSARRSTITSNGSRPRLKGGQGDDVALRRGLSHLLQRDLKDLDRVSLIDAIERIERAGRPGAARDLRKHLRTFLNRQLSLGVIAIDPLAGYRAAAATKEDTLEAEEHGMALSEDEIVAIWRAASSIGGPFGGLVKMGLMTGLRRGELAAMRWDWIDREALQDHHSRQDHEERPRARGSDHWPDREAPRRDPRPRRRPRVPERKAPRRGDAACRAGRR